MNILQCMIKCFLCMNMGILLKRIKHDLKTVVNDKLVSECDFQIFFFYDTHFGKEMFYKGNFVSILSSVIML